MRNFLNSIKVTREPYNRHDLTHDIKMSGKMGQLMPCCVIPTIPGDKYNIGSDVFLRFAPLISPVMHRMDVTVHYFFVPYRILWENFEKWITGKPTGGFPQIEINAAWNADQERLGDYLGFPPFSQIPGAQDTLVSAMPFAAYQCIYNEYYRDQNLIPDVPYQLVDGVNPLGQLANLRKRAWMKDYFTAALPFAQAGAAVDIPLGDVVLKNPLTGSPFFQDSAGNITGGAVGNAANPVPPGGGTIDVAGTPGQIYNPDGTLEVAPTTLNDLRTAWSLQRWLEKQARGGRRYIEFIKNMFDVDTGDARLQRPEYICGIKSPVVVSEVLNTTGSFDGPNATSPPQGSMAGHAVSVGTKETEYYYTRDYGIIMGIVSVMPLPAYQQGIQREWYKTEPEELYYPDFAHLGEQAIKTKEIFAYQNTSISESDFGYIPMYSEYKYQPNRVAGDFRTTLNYWHLGRIFTAPPGLNQDFIEVDPQDVERIFAVGANEDNLYIQVLNKVDSQRKMPIYSTPA